MLSREARTGFEPVITVLQTGALPLGDRAIFSSDLSQPIHYISELSFRQQIIEKLSKF